MNKIISVAIISTLILIADSSHITNSNNLQELQHRTSSSSSTVRNSENSMLVRHQGSVRGSSAPSHIQANKNINLNLVNKSKIESSSIGMKIRAKGSKIQSNKNINLDLVNKSDIENSNVGLSIDAR